MKQKNLNKVAIIYDFDGTLAKGNIQEGSFIPSIGMDTTEFWRLVKQQAKDSDADEILTYMHQMLRLAKEKDIELTRKQLQQHGKSSELFNGLENGYWFDRINNHGRERNLEIEHFIVSSGIYEMIQGSKISKYFKHIFASKFHYDDNGNAIWPAQAINYTTKTQFLFRINKGISNSWDNETINDFMPEDERPIPFERMIFIGDGDTDIPTMKMNTYKGGSSIAVYDPNKSDRDLNKIHKLISDARVDFVAPADYSLHSQLDIVVKGVLGRIARKCGYRPD